MFGDHLSCQVILVICVVFSDGWGGGGGGGGVTGSTRKEMS